MQDCLTPVVAYPATTIKPGKPKRVEYGLIRVEADPPHIVPGWMVILHRRKRHIQRFFGDAAHGDIEAARVRARAYRDALLVALPPITNREKAVSLRKNNKSGIAGVRRGGYHDGVYWEAALQHGDKTRRKRFLISAYGEERAKALAIELRASWLEEMKPKFLVQSDKADQIAQAAFGELLDRNCSIHPTQFLSEDEIDERIAELDAQFELTRPRQILVRVKQYQQAICDVYVSNREMPAWRRLKRISARQTRSPAEVLDEARSLITGWIGELYSNDIATWFMATHGDQLLNPDAFDLRTGASLSVFLPDRQ